MGKSPRTDTSSDAAAPDADATKAESRAAGFMRSALAIIGETGRADFTVLEVVERSKTSLRSFYQHYTTKDDLLLALIGKIMSESADRWRDRHRRPAAASPHCAVADRTDLHACRVHHPGQAQSRPDLLQRPPVPRRCPREYARVMSPVHELIKDIITAVSPTATSAPASTSNATAALIMQIRARRACACQPVGAELTASPVDADHIYEFCLRRLSPAADPA